MDQEVTCECSFSACPRGHNGVCLAEGAKPYWEDMTRLVICLCDECRLETDRPLIQGEGMGAKRFYLAYPERDEKDVVAVYASSLEEAERLAGVYPWEKGLRVVVREATPRERVTYDLREVK